MLQPNDRKHLFESIRPPEGYELSFALGTTYSLDLTTLLTVPIGFAFNEYEGDEPKGGPDPLLILETIKQYSGKIAVFCQTGQIKVPTQKNAILNAYTESAVYQAQAPTTDGIFHPKVWVLRYVSLEKGPVKYRVLVLSRNLTYDKSWDTVVALDGEVIERKNAIGHCRPLSEFVAALPKLSKDKPAKHVSSAISTISKELLVTQFELPEGIDELIFWSLGLDPGKRANPKIFEWPIKAVISPFLSESFIKEYLKENTENAILVSRKDSLDAISKKTLSIFDRIYILDEGAAQIEQEKAAEKDKPLELTGLHSKIYHMESGWNASIVTGSANATQAAFTKNVEFMVELVGKKSSIGIGKFLERIQGETTFADLLVPYTPPEKAMLENAEQRLLEDAMSSFCQVIQENIRNGDVSQNESSKTVAMNISWKPPLTFEKKVQTTVACRPITLSNVFEKNITAETKSIGWDNISIEALTSFLAFRVEMKSENESFSHEFVLKINLAGIPEDRLASVTGAVLSNRQEFIRLLRMILGISEVNDTSGAGSINPKGELAEPSNAFAMSNGLLEMMLIAVSREPKRIDRIEGIVADLKKSEEGKKLLTEDFELVWNPILEAKRGRNV